MNGRLFNQQHLTAQLSVQNLNILMIGAQNGKDGFFPKGIQGKINSPVGFDKLAEATEDWTGLRESEQVQSLLDIPCSFHPRHLPCNACMHCHVYVLNCQMLLPFKVNVWPAAAGCSSWCGYVIMDLVYMSQANFCLWQGCAPFWS